MMTQWLYTITSTHTLMSYRVGVGKDNELRSETVNKSQDWKGCMGTRLV